MTPDPALDAVIRRARHLVFAFDGPIRSVDAGKPVNSTTTTAPHIHEVLTACRESGRSASVISTNPQADVRAYLDVHDLLTQVAVVAASLGEAASALKVSPTECTVITSSPDDIEDARAAQALAIAYIKNPDDIDHLNYSGASAVISSMTNLALTLRAQASD